MNKAVFCRLKDFSASLISLAVVSFLALGCGQETSKLSQGAEKSSQVTSVALPLTPVEDQGRIGLCWAYGTMGLIESHAKSTHGRVINISEEALAFYHLAHYLTQNIQSLEIGDLLTFLSRGLNEGFYTRLPKDRRQHGELDALDLVKKYGVVPESAWSFKFTSDAARQSLISAIRQNTLQSIAGLIRKDLTVEFVMKNILVGKGAFPSKPPTNFAYEGKQMTAQQMLTEVAAFDPDAYEAVETRSLQDLDTVIHATKRALARGVSVPFGFPINIRRLKGDIFTGKDVADPEDHIAFSLDGGHLVLVTDFVNVNGRAGLLPTGELQKELGKPSSEIDHIVFKNSWGVGAKTNETGLPVGFSVDGFYKMDQSYLQGAARASAKGALGLIAVVPSDIARDPFGVAEPKTVSADVAVDVAVDELANIAAAFPAQQMVAP